MTREEINCSVKGIPCVMSASIKMAVVTMAFLATSGMMCSAPAAATLLALQPGMEGPEFSLRSLDGKPKTFSGIKGEKLTILVFWSSWSSKSEKVLERMQKLFEKYKEQGLAIVGINADEQKISDMTLSAIRMLRGKLKIGYPMVVDDGLAVFHDYGVIALPTTVIMNPERKITYELSGYPLVGSESMVEFIVSTMEGKKPAIDEEKKRYQPKGNAMRLYNMGKATLKSKGMADKAEMWFKKASDEDPEFALPYLSLGMVYANRGEAAMAQAKFKKVLEREPNNPVALCELGMILINDGKTQEGMVLLETARKKEESYLPCYYYAGYAYGKAGKPDEAMKMFDEAVKVNPTDHKIFLYEGRLFEEQREMKKAAEAYRTALEKILVSD